MNTANSHPAAKLAVACILVQVLASSGLAAVGDQLHKLLPLDGAAYDYFGETVGIDGSLAIVGADSADALAFNSGAAYLFDVPTGDQLYKLLPDDGRQEEFFGSSVGISGDVAVVGATIARNAEGVQSGAAYLFDVNTGDQVAKLTASDGGASDSFGNAVAISGSRVVVGAYWANAGGLDAGSAYLFDTTGSQLAIFGRTDSSLGGDYFGGSVGIDGDRVIIGAPRDEAAAVKTGSAYLYDLATSDPPLKITPTDGAAGDQFGYSVAISGNVAIVGSRHATNGETDTGAAYLFDFTTGDQLAKLLPYDGVSSDFFGHSVAISGNLAIVGAHSSDSLVTNSGAAYLFDLSTYEQLAKITASDAAAFDSFGIAVGISGDRAVVGASLNDDHGGSSGSAYVFAADFLNADFDKDGEVDGEDFLIWQAAFLTMDGTATSNTGDANGDGNVDGQDFLIWQNEFGSGLGGAGQVTVPEPAAVALFLLALVTNPVRRRR